MLLKIIENNNMLLSKQMFFRELFDLVKNDYYEPSYYNAVIEIIDRFELDGYEVGEWIKEDPIILNYIKDEFKIKEKSINDLF